MIFILGFLLANGFTIPVYAHDCHLEELQAPLQDPKTPEEWSQYNRRRLSESFNKLLPELMRAYAQGNNILVDFLDAASGHTLLHEARTQYERWLEEGKSNNVAFNVSMPSLEKIIEYYNQAVDKLVAQGSVPGGIDGAIKVGRIFIPVDNGKLQNRSRMLPLVWTNNFNPENLQPYSGNQNGLIYDYTFGELGLFVVSDAKKDLWNDMPQTLHDLAHLASMLKHPAMMAAWRDFSRYLYRDQEAQKFFRKTKVVDASIKKPLRDRENRTLFEPNGEVSLFRNEFGATVPNPYSLAFVRGVITFEYMTRVSDVAPFRAKMILPPLEEGAEIKPGALKVSQVKAFLKDIPLNKKIETVQSLWATFTKNNDFIGGAAVDVLGNRGILAGRLPGFEISINRFFGRALTAAAKVRFGLTRTEELDSELARLQVALIEFHKLDAPQWVTELKATHLPPNSPLRKIICETELYSPNSYIYEAVCL